MTRDGRMTKPALLVGTTLTAVALLCGTSQAQEQPRRGGTLVYAVLGDPPTIDCHAATSFASLHYVAPHYSLLIKIDPEKPSEVAGDLAQSWSISDDKLTYTFKLHPNVKFHDGTALTSADVKASYDRIRQPPAGVLSVRAGAWSRVADITAPDPATVEFKMKSPAPSFLSTLASPFNCVYSAARLAADAKSPANEVMGSGPFVFTERVRGSHWTGKRYEGYHRAPRPYLDGFKAINTSPASLTSAIQSGQVMGEFRTLTPAQRDQLKEAMGDKVRFYEKTYDFVILLAFNTGKKPFDDARVRRALSLAIDRRAAAVSLAKVSSMTFVGATQRPESPWAASEAELAALPGFGTDIAAARAEARRLLKEAGHENLKLKLVNRNITNPYTSAGIYIVDQWRQIGVTAEHAQVDVSALMTAMREAQFDAIIDFGGEWVDDPSVVLGRYQSSDVSSYAASRFTDRKVDELYKVIDTTFDPVVRKQVLRELETHVMSEANLVPFLWLNRIVGLSSQVRGFRITPTHFVNQDLADIWLAQ